jgi:replication factor C subunit 3/5
MLFYGPSGAGKKTRISCTLRELFGSGAEKVSTPIYVLKPPFPASDWSFFLKLKIDQRVFMTPSKRRLDLNIVQSNFHIEITPR